MAEVGPVEVIVVGFPGSNFNGKIAPALADIVSQGIVTVLDLAFITKTEDGSVAAVEIADVDDDPLEGVDVETGDLLGLLNDEDLLAIGESLDPGSSAIAIVFEHSWARKLSAAVRGSDGQILFAERISAPEVEAALAAVGA